MARSIIAVVGGFACIVLVVIVSTVGASVLMLPRTPNGEFGDPTRAYLAVNLVFSGAAAVLGGYVAGKLAGSRPFLHAAVLAAVLMIMSFVSAVTTADTAPASQPGWYGPVIAVIGVAGVLLGGWWRRRQTTEPVVV